ncbi:MAG: hypothetical protein ABSF48_22220 [Thermodesulfobacteriota bacterium]|jgi:hypothetical protein
MEKEDWWGGRIFEIISLMEFTAAILYRPKIKLDPSKVPSRHPPGSI